MQWLAVTAATSPFIAPVHTPCIPLSCWPQTTHAHCQTPLDACSLGRHAQVTQIPAFDKAIEGCIKRGWPRERAVIFQLMQRCVNAIGRALRQGDPRYAASTYALCDALFAQQADEEVTRLENARLAATQAERLGGACSMVAPPLSGASGPVPLSRGASFESGAPVRPTSPRKSPKSLALQLESTSLLPPRLYRHRR